MEYASHIRAVSIYLNLSEGVEYIFSPYLFFGILLTFSTSFSGKLIPSLLLFYYNGHWSSKLSCYTTSSIEEFNLDLHFPTISFSICPTLWLKTKNYICSFFVLFFPLTGSGKHFYLPFSSLPLSCICLNAVCRSSHIDLP